MWLWIKITEKILTRWLINEFLAANSRSVRPNGVCLSVHPSVQAQNMFLRDGEKCSSSTVGLFSQMLFEWSQRHWKPRPRKQGYDNAGRVLVEVPGVVWGGCCTLCTMRKWPRPRPAATHGARTHMFYPVRGVAGRGQLISPGLAPSRTRSDFHDMIEVCWRPCGRLPATRCTETRPDLGALLGCTKADTAARTGDHYSYSRHVATAHSWERLTSNLN